MVNPLDYIMSQQSRRDEQIRNLVNTFLAMKEHKYRQGQQEIENQRETERASREERRIKLAEDMASRQEIKEPYIPKEVQDAQYYAQVMGGQPVDVSQFTPAGKRTERLKTLEDELKLKQKYRPTPAGKQKASPIMQKIRDIESRLAQQTSEWGKNIYGSQGQPNTGLELTKSAIQNLKLKVMNQGEASLTPQDKLQLDSFYAQGRFITK